MSYLPLAGVKVLDLTRMIPGDLATRKLADLGADVVKLEDPGRGDYLRSLPPIVDGQGLTFIGLNRNKRSVEADLRTPAGRDLFDRLAAVADVVVEVSHPGRWLKVGIDLAELRRRRPELVVCSISGFGQTGPLAQLPSHGMTMDALAGIAPIFDTPDGKKRISIQVGTTLTGELGALNAALAIVSAVLHVRSGGAGVWIDASLWDAGAEAHRGALARGDQQLDDGGRAADFNENSLYGVYECEGGTFVLIAAIERKYFETFCRGAGRPDLVEHWGAGDGGAMDFGKPELRRELEQIFLADPADVWFERFVEWDVPGALILEGSQLAGLAHTRARGLLEPDWHHGLANVLDPIRWADDGSRPGEAASAPPAIGQDTDAVVHDWLGE